MADKNKINKLIKNLNNHKGHYCSITWNDSPTNDSAMKWIESKIGNNPQSVMGHILKMIDQEIHKQMEQGASTILDKMLEYKKMPTLHEEKITKASGYLSIPTIWGRKLMDLNSNINKQERTKEEIIEALEELILIDCFSWKDSS